MSKHHQEKQFGIILACIVAAVSLWPLKNGQSPAWLWLIVSGVLLLVSLLAAGLLSPVLKVWMKVGHFVGLVNTKILLAIAFYIVITPLALFFRLVGRDALSLRQKKLASYWLVNKKKWSPDEFKNQF